MREVNNIPIFHIASIARSGETILMRNLSVHTKIKIVHNFWSSDTFIQQAMYKHLKKRSNTKISRFNFLALPYRLKKGDVLILKQGVWRHPFQFQGLILVRNPLSIFASLRSYDEKHYDIPAGKVAWDFTNARLRRWLADEAPKALNGYDEKTPIEQFSIYYNNRMENLLSRDLPILRYEDLVTSPQQELARVLNIIGVDIQDKVFHAEKEFEDGYLGHGFSDFSKPLNSDSLKSYQNKLSEDEIYQLTELTSNFSKELGYIL